MSLKKIPPMNVWYNVQDCMPPDRKFVIVRCIDRSNECDFYFMALYAHNTKRWLFFDECYDNKMQVTHWQKTIDLPFDIAFIEGG